MAKNQAVPTPPIDPHKLLGQLETIVKNNTKPAATPNQATGKSWIGTAIIVAVVLAGIAVWSWISWRRNKELADLRHEKEKQRILAEKAEADRRVALSQVTIDKAEAELKVARETERHIDADIRAEEVRYETDLRTIDRIRSWRNVAGGS